jgi:hypothetical protein
MGTMPPMTASLECIPVCSSVIRPSAVTTQAVHPKLNLALRECFIVNLHCRYKSAH